MRRLRSAVRVVQGMLSSGPSNSVLHVTGLLLAGCFCGSAAPGTSKPQQQSRHLLVVAPKQFQQALGPFLAEKQKRVPTEYQSLEFILQNTSGADDPEKLKRFFYSEWREHKLGYVLLVGDVDVMPVRYMVLDRVTPTAFDYAFYPSDLYYADLAKRDGSFDDWNARKEDFHAQYFGEVRGEKNKSDPINLDEVDYRPEIAVGRWPVSTPDEVARVASKTLRYDRAHLSDSRGESARAAFIATSGWVDSRGLLDRLAARLTNHWHVEKRFYGDARQPGDSPPPSHAEVQRLFNQGLTLAVHTGHGQPMAWEQCFSLKDLDAITNCSTLPVVISAGCSTAYFAPLAPYEPYVDIQGKEHAGTDHQEVFESPPPPPCPYQRGKLNGSGLGEQLLKRGPTGAVVYIGCNTGSQPCGLTLVEGFVTAAAELPRPCVGDCWAAALCHYYEREHLATLKPNADWYPPSIFFQGMKFMLFGDPTLRLPANQ